MAEIEVHALREHQTPIADSPARFKVVRAGRRFGKDALAEHISLLGHGPDTQWKGLVHGLDVVWLAPTIPQAGAMWKNEVEPRFRNKDGIDVNKNEKCVSLLNPDGSAYSTLWVKSAEALRSIRGIGKKLAGVVINEAAWLDLEEAWRDVLRATLMDNNGWAVIMSTTNGGPDGHLTENGDKRSPSFFNILCEEIQQGKRGPEWAEFYGTAEDNPTISPSEFKALVEEYDPNSVTLAQEVYAKLVVGGAGVAFPIWNDDQHITDFEPEKTGEYFRWDAGMDWGYEQPGWYGQFAADGNGRSYCRWEYRFQRTDPYTVGFNIGQQLRTRPVPEWISLDSACWAVTTGGPTIAEEIQRGLKDALKHLSPAVIASPKGPGSREAGYSLLQKALLYKRDPNGNVPAWLKPMLMFHRSCTYAISVFQRIPKDPKGKDDVDTDADDHPYDGVRYRYMARPPVIEKPEQDTWEQNRHPGFNDGARRRPWAIREEEPVSTGRWQGYDGTEGGEW